MSKPQRVYDSAGIKAETQHIKSYKVVINALKQELYEKEKTIEQLQSLFKSKEFPTNTSGQQYTEPAHKEPTIQNLSSIQRYHSIERSREEPVKSHRVSQEGASADKRLNRTLPMSEGRDEDVLRQKVEVQGRIIAEHEYTIRCLRLQNEKLRKTCGEGKSLKEELEQARQHITDLSNEIQAYRKEGSNGDFSHDKRDEKELKEQLNELLTQNEYLREEIQQLQNKLSSLSTSPQVFHLLTLVGHQHMEEPGDVAVHWGFDYWRS